GTYALTCWPSPGLQYRPSRPEYPDSSRSGRACLRTCGEIPAGLTACLNRPVPLWLLQRCLHLQLQQPVQLSLQRLPGLDPVCRWCQPPAPAPSALYPVPELYPACSRWPSLPVRAKLLLGALFCHRSQRYPRSTLVRSVKSLMLLYTGLTSNMLLAVTFKKRKKTGGDCSKIIAGRAAICGIKIGRFYTCHILQRLH